MSSLCGFISSLALLLTAYTAAALQLSILPKKDVMTVSIGTSAMLTCEVTETGSKIQWFDTTDKEVTAITGRVFIESSNNSSRLYVKDIKNADSGTYKCVASMRGNKQEGSIRLAVFQDITFTHLPNPQHPAIHTDATIACKVEGEPKPEVSWKYKGKPIELGGRIKQSHGGLNVTRITQEDDGDYTCIARVPDTGRYEERVITVKVHIPPKVKTTTMRIEGTQGTNASLTCSATGLPSPKYEFYKDRETKSLSTSGNIIVDNDYGKIHFRPLRKQNNGTYMCKAFNDAGHDEISGTVTVNVAPKIIELNNITVKEGNPIRLICKSEGLPYPEMVFRKDGRLEGPYKIGTNDVSRVMVASRTAGELELTIQRAEPSDAGNYTCISQNKINRHQMTGSITVEYQPRVVDSVSRHVYSWRGRTRNITCEVDAYPLPRFKWLRNHREIQDVPDKYRVYSSGKVSNLEVKVSMSDTDWKGDYMCEAINTIGRNDVKIRLEEAGTPGKPGQIEIIDRTPNMIVLSVMPPKATGGVNIVAYRLEYEGLIQEVTAGFPDGYYLTVPEGFSANKDDPVELRIENLNPETQYSFKIRARNEVGISQEFVIFNASTTEIREPYPVKIISARRGTESHSYTIHWASPQTGGKPIKYYNISYGKATIDKEGRASRLGPWKDTNTMDTPKRPITKFTLNNLEPETAYMLRIMAGNEMTSKSAKFPPTPFIFETSKVNPLKSSSHAGISAYHGSSSLAALLTFTLLTLLHHHCSTGQHC